MPSRDGTGSERVLLVPLVPACIPGVVQEEGARGSEGGGEGEVVVIVTSTGSALSSALVLFDSCGHLSGVDTEEESLLPSLVG